MTTVTSATSTTGTTTAPSYSPSSSTAAISSDFETFLKMLTVQMQNQDPLNPIESSDYAVQLATFSGVEQQVKTNDLLQSLATQMGMMGMTQFAGWVGMEARSDAPAYYDGTPVTVAPNPVTGSDQAILVAHNATGAEVSRAAIAISADPVSWDGVTTNGATLPAGLYTFTLECYNNGSLLSTSPVETYNRITEAQGTGNGTTLVLRGGTTIGTEDVTALRDGS